MTDIEVAETCARIKLLYTRYRIHAKAIQRLEGTARSLVVSALSTTATGKKLTLKARFARAGGIVQRIFSGKPQEPADRRLYGRVKGDLAVLALSREPLAATRDALKRELEQQTLQLPVAEWQRQIPGFGVFGLAVVIGESGNLSDFPNPAKVWKRLGLAPFQKGGLTRAASTWRMKGGLSAGDWRALGYSPQRRAALFAHASHPLFLRQSKVAGYYRTVYDERRSHTGEVHPDWRKGHQHADALRYMTKRLILDLWSEWRRAEPVV